MMHNTMEFNFYLTGHTGNHTKNSKTYEGREA